MKPPKRNSTETEDAPQIEDAQVINEEPPNADYASQVLSSLASEPETDETGQPIEPVVSDRVDREIFYTTMFSPMFNLASHGTGVKEAKIQEDEEDVARDASGDLYDLLEQWYPSALDPSASTFKKLFTVGGFFYFKATIIRAGLMQRRMAQTQTYEPEQAPQQQQPHEQPQTPAHVQSWEEAGAS